MVGYEGCGIGAAISLGEISKMINGFSRVNNQEGALDNHKAIISETRKNSCLNCLQLINPLGF